MLTLEQLREDAKASASKWEIDWEVIDSSIGAHEDFKRWVSWAEDFDMESAESVYNKIYNAIQNNNSSIPLDDDDYDFNLDDFGSEKYLAECEKSIREAYILRDLHMRYNLIMSITEGV